MKLYFLEFIKKVESSVFLVQNQAAYQKSCIFNLSAKGILGGKKDLDGVDSF